METKRDINKLNIPTDSREAEGQEGGKTCGDRQERRGKTDRLTEAWPPSQRPGGPE